jgi:hypothetical protein
MFLKTKTRTAATALKASLGRPDDGGYEPMLHDRVLRIEVLDCEGVECLGT